jgi:RNA 3'-terminal phosphate cyclase (ATP)
MAEPVGIDGAAGGGQMLRNAVALSAVTGRPVRVVNIRGARPQPGLRPQHLLALKTAAHICEARLLGAEIGSREIEFWPRAIRTTERRLDVGTAGSVMLVLQCVLPALSHAPASSALTLIGGTDVPFAPPFDYFDQVFLPALRDLGPGVSAVCAARGFYPKGGGEVRVRVDPSPAIGPITWRNRSPVVRIRGIACSLGLPDHIARRMRVAAANRLIEGGYRGVEIKLEVGEKGRSEGCGIVLWAECEGGRRLGASALGRRGKRAEEVGEEAAQQLLDELASGGAMDSHLADQMIVWMALADGPSELTTSRVTDHARSAIAVAEALTEARFEIQEAQPVLISCRKRGRGGQELNSCPTTAT